MAANLALALAAQGARVGLLDADVYGPNVPPAREDCAPADWDGDMDVDLVDFGVFQACFNGPNRPPACGLTSTMRAAG